MMTVKKIMRNMNKMESMRNMIKFPKVGINNYKISKKCIKCMLNNNRKSNNKSWNNS